MQKYSGEIVSVKADDEYGFIGIRTVTKDDGTPHELPTDFDIFIHQDECDTTLRVGMTVDFMVAPDAKRGDGKFRAQGAIEHVEGELIPSGELPVPGFPVSAPLSLQLSAKQAAYLSTMKAVPEGTVAEVIENQPMPDIPRDQMPRTDEEKRMMLEAFLRYLFPMLADYGSNFSLSDFNEEEFEEKVAEVKEQLEALGMKAQIPVLDEEVRKFKATKSTLAIMWQDGLVKPGTIIPVKYLPDLFMAAPVWYHWLGPNQTREAESLWNDQDPRPHEVTKYFCDLFPNPRWRDTFQMFNRRLRLTSKYDGDIIPPHVLRRIGKATEIFDYVVIATPYLEEAGKDWEDIDWLRSIDPYVLGFIKGLNVFFVLARFSDTGTFPLYDQLVADTIEFLRANSEKLKGFDLVRNPYWYQGSSANLSTYNLGTRLKEHTAELLKAFEARHLFDWLRGEADVNS